MKKDLSQTIQTRSVHGDSTSLHLKAGASSTGSGGMAGRAESKATATRSGEKIDMFCHILPKKFNEALLKKSRPCYYLRKNSLRPALNDLC